MISIGNTIPPVFIFLVSLLISFYLVPLPCHSVATTSPVGRGGCLIACVHTECCIWTFESNLINFIMVRLIICYLAVGLHNYFFRFFSGFLSFVLCCIIVILSDFSVARVEAFKNIAAI